MPNGHFRWCFTLNNYTDPEQDVFRGLVSDEVCRFVAFAREVGESGTPHLQGVLILSKRSVAPSRLTLKRAHFEPMRGTPLQALEYIRPLSLGGRSGIFGSGETAHHKDANADNTYEEFGSLDDGRSSTSSSNGSKSGERWREAVSKLQSPADVPALWDFVQMAVPGYSRVVHARLNEVLSKKVQEEEAGDYPEALEALRPWQRSFVRWFDSQVADDRRIFVIYGASGAEGKSWLGRWLVYRRGFVDVPAVAARDMAREIPPGSSRFYLDLARDFATKDGDFTPYSFLEKVKSGRIPNPKYDGQTVVVYRKNFVVLTTNSKLDVEKISSDRLVYWEIDLDSNFSVYSDTLGPIDVSEFD